MSADSVPRTESNLRLQVHQRVKALLEIRKVELVLEDTTRDHSLGIKGLMICRVF